MMRVSLVLLLLAVLGLSALAILARPFPATTSVDVRDTDFDVKRGAYLARISGCVACHTDSDGGGEPLAGGTALRTKFGTFYSPNITPHGEYGIGDWSLDEFARAVRDGIDPDGKHYYPAFPYPFYDSLDDRDIVDLWAAIQTVPAAAIPSKPHDVSFPFNIRAGLGIWKSLFLSNAGDARDRTRSAGWNRGRFIVEGPAHCGACHTPRNFAGARNIRPSIDG